MRVRHGFRALTSVALMATSLGAAALTTSASSAGAAASTSSAPGVTSNSITVGTISTQTGTLASNFSSLIYGERAYFDYINAQGGVNGRKINYKYALDDGGNPTTFNQLANTLINQDHVFAVTGVATAFFSPNLFVESGIPTYGYNVTGNWAGPPNLFAAGGSVQYYPARAPEVTYVARKTQKKPSIAFLAYGVAASAAACQAEQNCSEGRRLQRQLLRPQGQLSGLDRRHRRPAHEAGRLQYGRQLHGRAGQRHHGPGDQAVRAGNMTQLWFSGNDQSTLNSNESLMQNVYFTILTSRSPPRVQLTRDSSCTSPQMKKYEPKYVTDEIAIQGWESAALFVQGVKMAGNNLTQANVIKADNSSRRSRPAGSSRRPTGRAPATAAMRRPIAPPTSRCPGTKYVPTLNKGKNVFNCFESINPKKGPVFPLPPGTPAPA